MKKIMIGALAILAIATPFAANAAPKSKTHAASTAKHEKLTTTLGVIAAWAPDTRMLKLSDGSEFKVDDKVKAANYTTGKQVTVRWEAKDGAKLAEAVTVK